MKTNKKHFFNTNKLSQALKYVFSAFVPAVFLIEILLGSFLGLKSNYPVKRTAFSYNLAAKNKAFSKNGIILQTPTEDSKWANKKLVHKYLYQAHGIDISQNISFLMEDGTMLDQDFKVTKDSSESDLKINDFAYVAIRY